MCQDLLRWFRVPIRQPGAPPHFAISLALLSLLLPPQVLASIGEQADLNRAKNEVSLSTEDLPDHFIINYRTEGLSYEFNRQPNGDYHQTDSTQCQTIDAALINQATIEVLEGDDSGGPFNATGTIPNGLEGTLSLELFGDWDPATGMATATLILSDGSLLDIDILIPDATVIIQIVVSAALVWALGCSVAAIVTNCIKDCGEGCKHGMSSAKEDFCGTCTCDCVDPPIPGVTGRPLVDQIDLGHNASFTGAPGSGDIQTGSIYLIQHDPARSVRRGHQLFHRQFTENQRLGPSGGRPRGAGLVDSCAGCHGRPRGSAGAGGVVQTFPDSRDTPQLFGLGLQEQLADEMTSDMRAIRDQAIAVATGGGSSQTLVDEDFDDGTFGAFNFQDDPQDPSSTSGGIVFVGNDNFVQIDLGGISDDDIFDMEAGYVTTFNMSSAANATLTLSYRLVQSPDYESDELSQAYVEVDGNRTTLATFIGDGNGGTTLDTGVHFASIDLGSLAAGSHTLFLAGFNNKKTLSDEFTQVSYNDVRLTTDAGCPIVVSLETKGVNFGSIEVACDGTVDYSGVDGVDAPKLRVRPFFAEGRTRSIREHIFADFNDHMGIRIYDPVLCAVTDPANPVAVTSPSGFNFDPALDTYERPAGCDGPSELDVATVDHLEFYLLNSFKPGRYMETTRTQLGDALLDTVGCTKCHVRNLTIDRDRRVVDVETGFDPVNGIFNELFATASTRIVVVPDPGSPFPFVLPEGNSYVVEDIFTDFKRHDLGPDFDERAFDGTLIREHQTEPLWGAGTSAPYGHDGRSINLDAVIRRHGGEAAAATLAYASLSDDDQRKIQEFISTLILFPPDDTASNLHPGNPQEPDQHGSINLEALFQIPSSDIGDE